MTHRPVLMVLVALLAACSDVTPPDRNDTYPFTISCPSHPGCTAAAGNLQATFRWPREALPVRIWVEPGSNLQSHVANAIVLWERAALYGEFRGVLVRDSSAADVVFLRSPPEEFSRANSMEAPLDCRGQTAFAVSPVDTSMVLPFLTFLSARSGRADSDVNACFEAVAAHELGHSLGLLLHSEDGSDLMSGRPRRPEFSARDRASFVRLYHTAPTIRLPTGR